MPYLFIYLSALELQMKQH